MITLDDAFLAFIMFLSLSGRFVWLVEASVFVVWAAGVLIADGPLAGAESEKLVRLP